MTLRRLVRNAPALGLALFGFSRIAGASPPPAVQFLADSYGNGGFFQRPNGQGAAGPSHLVFVDDANFIIQTKAGSAVSSTGLLSFWSAATGFPPGGANSRSVSSPRVYFDPSTGRYIATAIGFTTPLLTLASFPTTYYHMIAISDTSDPRGTWKKYAFNLNTVSGAPIRPTGLNPTQTGFSDRWIAMTLVATNLGVADGCHLYVYEKAHLMSGAITTATVTRFGRQADNPLSPMVPSVATTQDELYLLEARNGDPGISYRMSRVFNSDIVNYRPVGSVNTRGYIFLASTISAHPQSGGGGTLNVSKSEIQSLAFDGTSLGSAQAVLPNNAPGRIAVRWMKWNLTAGILDQGHLEDPTGVFWYDYPSLTVNTSGDMMVGFTRFSPGTFPSAGYAFRAATDPAGTLQSPEMYKPGTHAFSPVGASNNPWGAISGTSLDPADGLSFWTSQEFANDQFVNEDTLQDAWGIQWAKAIPPIAAPTIGVPLVLSSASIRWNWTDNAYNEANYVVRWSSNSSAMSPNLAANTTFYTQTGLTPNSPQQVFSQAFNAAASANSANTALTYTLANPPTGSAVLPSSASVQMSWTSNGNPAGTIYRAEIAPLGGSFVEFFSGTNLSAIAVSLSTGTYEFRVRAENGDGETTLYDTVVGTDVVFPNIFILCDAGGVFIFGGVEVTVPPNVAPCGTQLTINLPGTLPAPLSPLGTLNGLGVSSDIESNNPICGLRLKVHYQAADLQGADASRLFIARFDEARDLWIPLPSVVDTLLEAVTTEDFCPSLVQLVMTVPSATVSTAKIYPNPARRSRGDTRINFTDLPVDAEIRVYTLSAEKVKELRTDSGGNAVWDLTNESGQAVASGTFIGVMKGAGGKEGLKLVVQE